MALHAPKAPEPGARVKAPEIATQTIYEVRRCGKPRRPRRIGLSLRQHSAEATQSFVQAEHAISKARAVFGRMSWETADIMRQLVDDARDEASRPAAKVSRWTQAGTGRPRCRAPKGELRQRGPGTALVLSLRMRRSTAYGSTKFTLV